MSTITPLIDTLLHQVLGKGGPPGPREANPPVRPIDPGEGPRALRSDSRLDARADPRLGGLDRLPARPGTPAQAGTGAALPPSGSTQTHFSPAARSLADLLLRFPAPPSVVRPQAPLMAAEPASPGVLAQRLEASVRDSGLFYEAHLKRWFQGDMPRQQLLREPQMQPGIRPLPMPDAAAAGTGTSAGTSGGALAARLFMPGAPPLVLPAPVPFVPGGSAAMIPGGATGSAGGSGVIIPGSVLLPAPPTAAHVTPGAASAAAPATAATAGDASSVEARSEMAALQSTASAARGRDVVHESLQGLVRQQLDMLVTPTMRWEGDVWAGVFMALVVNLPRRGDEQSGEESAGRDESPEGWQSDIRLDVPGLGAFDASLRLHRKALSVDFSTPDGDVHARLEDALERLESRLAALDLQRVSVRAHHLSEAGDEG